MYVWFIVLDLAFLGFLLSMQACLDGPGDPVYISEWIYQCKQHARLQALPWVVVVLLGAVVFWQLAWMYRVAREHEHGRCALHRAREASAAPMIFFSVLSVVGAFMVVFFDNHEEPPNMGHELGVLLLTLGVFVALHIVWAILRTGDSNERLQGTGVRRVPFYMWLQYDVAFALAIVLFGVSAFFLKDFPHTVSVVAEYVALALLFLQMFWLFLVCCERDSRGSETCTYAGFSAADGDRRRPETERDIQAGRVFLNYRARI
jgi:NADH:ubiquinone oxidoreductase subunit 5 (subunit L)/multisubunit Na+/H+ antiporter MnhA subunit